MQYIYYSSSACGFITNKTLVAHESILWLEWQAATQSIQGLLDNQSWEISKKKMPKIMIIISFKFLDIITQTSRYYSKVVK